MSDHNTSPVSLPAGSYDYDALKSATDKAAKGAAKSYEENVAEALDKSATNDFKPVDPRDTPGYVYKDVTREDLGVTETIQVYSPKLGEKIAEEGEGAIPAPVTAPRPAATGAASKE